MKIKLETERLILREIQDTDIDDLFEMDSDPEVHKYIENKPVKSKEELLSYIQMLQEQYAKNGTARWAVVDKETKEMLGWAGLKFFDEEVNGHHLFYELGYRFKRKHWGKGYATEASKAILTYGFDTFHMDSIFAMTDPMNTRSRHVLEKLGFEFDGLFDYDGIVTWYKLDKKI